MTSQQIIIVQLPEIFPRQKKYVYFFRITLFSAATLSTQKNPQKNKIK